MLQLCKAGTYIVTEKAKGKDGKNAGFIVRAEKGGKTMNNFIRIIMICCALTTHFALSGCGSGGSGGAQNAGVTFSPISLSSSPAVSAENSYSLTGDFVFPKATFMMATNSGGVFVLRVAVADKMTVDNPADIFRINILLPYQIKINSPYSLGGNNMNKPQAPVEIIFYNCQKSSLLNTISGSITFTSYSEKSGELVAGNFEVVIEEGNSGPSYPVQGSFNFVVNSSGPI
jgi:hypothetical protein